MNATYVTFGAFRNSPGHLARLRKKLKWIDASPGNGLILNLGIDDDAAEFKDQFPNTLFIHHPIQFDGWRVVDLDSACQKIETAALGQNSEIVILQMEVWDIMKAMSLERGSLPVACVLHAMPFLGAPLQCSPDFVRDVQKRMRSEQQPYRQEYLASEHLNFYRAVGELNLVANNGTVYDYVKNYFPDAEISLLPKMFTGTIYPELAGKPPKKYDLAFLARIEKGKGVEYLERVLLELHSISNKKHRLAIAGLPEDSLSGDAIRKLLVHADSCGLCSVDHLGWLDEASKKELLSNTRLFFYPSTYDNYPTALNEAIGFGIKCVIWDAPYSRLYEDNPGVSIAPMHDYRVTARAIAGELEREFDSSLAYRWASQYADYEQLTFSDTELFKRFIP